jgi:hypothetical protein
MVVEVVAELLPWFAFNTTREGVNRNTALQPHWAWIQSAFFQGNVVACPAWVQYPFLPEKQFQFKIEHCRRPAEITYTSRNFCSDADTTRWQKTTLQCVVNSLAL